MRLKFWYGLLIRDFISVASSNNDSHMLMKQKCKQRFAYNFFVFYGLKKKKKTGRNYAQYFCSILSETVMQSA